MRRLLLALFLLLGGYDTSNESRDYFDRLLIEARKATSFLKKPLLLVPVGHAMHALDQRMRAGEVSGYSDIHKLHKDGIHLNEAGSYLVGCTFFATLFGEDPAGLPTEPYGNIAPAVAVAVTDRLTIGASVAPGSKTMRLRLRAASVCSVPASSRSTASASNDSR